MTIRIDEGALTDRAAPGPALYFVQAMPQDAPKAVIGILHGYADHSARYLHVMGALAEHGIGSVAIDMRGHGRAEGERGYCDRFEEFLDDASELWRKVSDRAKGAPIFLFGHSFGGLVAAESAIEKPREWRGLLLSDPFFGLALQVSGAKLFAGRIASRVYPKLGLASDLHGKDLTHDAVRAKAYDDDPLVFKKATARWFRETQRAQERAFTDAGKLKMPLYMVFGDSDPVASFPEGKRFFDGAGSVDKTWDPREGLFHEVLNEPSWKDIVDKMAKWILERASAS